MELLKQAQIARLRGEHSQAEYLRQIIADEFLRLKEIAVAKRKADNLIFEDPDR